LGEHPLHFHQKAVTFGENLVKDKTSLAELQFFVLKISRLLPFAKTIHSSSHVSQLPKAAAGR
jgi:hypothetical protein